MKLYGTRKKEKTVNLKYKGQAFEASEFRGLAEVIANQKGYSFAYVQTLLDSGAGIDAILLSFGARWEE
jgi:hypothetical protein